MTEVIELKAAPNPFQPALVELLTKRLSEAAQGKIQSVIIAFTVPGDPRLFVDHVGIHSTFEVVGQLEGVQTALLPRSASDK